MFTWRKRVTRLGEFLVERGGISPRGSGVASGPAVPPGGTKNFQKYEKIFYTETKITVLSILKI